MGIRRKKPKVGLALGSGAARGFAHIGVLKVLEKAGIPIDMIAGTSMGSLVGAFYAYGMPLEEMEEMAIKLGAKRLKFLLDPALPRTGLVRGRRIEETLRAVIGNVTFPALKIPFVCVATDIDSGEEVVLCEGPVWNAVRASCSVPVILTAVRRQGCYLVDGGLVNPVPVSVLKARGADIIIAVNVIPRHEIPGKAAPGLFTIMMQTIHIASYQTIKASLAGADVVIEPQVGNIGYADFHRASECIMEGELAAKKALRKIRRRLATPKWE